MKYLGNIKTEYLYKTFENLAFLEIKLFEFIVDKIEEKKKAKDPKYKTKTNCKKHNKRKYPIIKSRHAMFFNMLIIVSYVSSCAMVGLLKVIGKLIILIYGAIKVRVVKPQEQASKGVDYLQDYDTMIEELLQSNSSIISFKEEKLKREARSS